MPYRVHLCSFSEGLFEAKSPSGKQGLLFDESDRFGPSKVHPRTGDLSEVPAGLHWFWRAYPAWRAAGRPTIGTPLDAPIGQISYAQFSASADTHPKGGDVEQAPSPMSGAVPNEDSGDAQKGSSNE